MANRERPSIMGILNVTSDSFSDGGRYLDPAAAVAHALKMRAAGADIIDVGGESTRPGAERIAPAVQKSRVLPVIRGIRAADPGLMISIDTTLAEVAEAAVEAGAGMINDISAGREDPAMFELAARRDTGLVLMHMQGTPATMQDAPSYVDVIAEVLGFLRERSRLAGLAGVRPSQIIIDPGIGFGKTLEHNLTILRNLDAFVGTGYRVLLGASRKRFLGTLCAGTDPAGLAGATAATTALGVMAGVGIYRVHDVKESRQAADVVHRIISPGFKPAVKHSPARPGNTPAA